jgi:hypothetical protein
VQLAWLGQGTTLLLDGDLPLGRHEHPTSAWSEGEIVRSPHRLRVPLAAPGGAYAVEATVIDSTGRPVSSPIIVAEGVLESTDRQMALSEPIRRRVDARLGAQVVLLGYDLPAQVDPVRLAPGEMLPVVLYWQTQREMALSYKVFVQLVGSAGALAQSDRIPVDWQRPTTGWLPGEVIVDEHILSLPDDAPPGEYALIAGMYDESTLQRLDVLDASGAAAGDHVTLEGIVVE